MSHKFTPDANLKAPKEGNSVVFWLLPAVLCGLFAIANLAYWVFVFWANKHAPRADVGADFFVMLFGVGPLAPVWLLWHNDVLSAYSVSDLYIASACMGIIGWGGAGFLLGVGASAGLRRLNGRRRP